MSRHPKYPTTFDEDKKKVEHSGCSQAISMLCPLCDMWTIESSEITDRTVAICNREYWTSTRQYQWVDR